MTTKFPSPLLGYNNNVRHKGKVFHIQTEDSGVKYGHIITHLFMDGGRILKSVKTGYAEYIGNERMADIVREMMKQQHKAMFIALRDGKFDAIVEGGADASQTTRAIVVDSPPSAAPAPPAAAAGPAPAPPVATAPVSQAPRAPALPSAFAPTQPLPVTVLPVSSARRPSAAPGALDEDGPPTIRQPESELTLDIDALQRATAAQGGSPGLRQASELPPPPANLFRDRGGLGKYRMTPVPPAAAVSASSPVAPAAPVAPVAPVAPAAPVAPVAQRAPTPPAASKPAAKASPSVPGATPVRKPSQASMPAAGERRYAPTRPAAIFGQTRPQPNKSVFGEDLISDKSLDEVILSYLAEDLDDKKKK
jgi:RecA/RadA recombinase